MATNGFEQSELFEPKKALEEAGAEVSIVSLESGEIRRICRRQTSTAKVGNAIIRYRRV